MAINNNYNNWSVGNSIENYNAKDWVTGELIRELALDNIENGINDNRTLLQKINTVLNNINGSNSDARISELENKIGKNVTLNNYANVITAINTLETRTNNLDEQGLINRVTASISNTLQTELTNAQNAIDNKLSTFNNTINSLVTRRDIYGGNAIENEGQASFKAWVSSKIDALGIDTINNNISNLSSRASNLETNATAIENVLGDATETYNTDNAKTVGARLTSLENSTAVQDIEKTLGVKLNNLLTAPSTTQTSSLYDMISQLQIILGITNNSGQSNTSLIDKIENALGRPLEPTAAEIEEDSLVDNSLLSLIENILGTLGMEGGTSSSSSNLVSDVNTALTLLYGYYFKQDPNDSSKKIIARNNKPDLNAFPLTNSYPTLYNDFYNGANGSVPVQLAGLATTVGENTQSINSLSSTVNTYDTAIESINTKYSGSDIITYEDSGNTYLALKMNRQKDVVQSEDDINSDTEIDYLLLPKMGGGGGVEYELDANIIQSGQTPIFPTNKVITLGNNYEANFIWQVTQNNNPQSLNGTLTVRLNNIVVDTIYIMSNTNFSLNLGQYITSTGNNSFVLLVSNPAVRQRTLYDTITVYNAVLTSTFNHNIIQTGSTINFPYVAAIGSTTVEKTLHIQIDDNDITLTGNVSTSESLRSVTFATPAAGDHILKIWFTASITNNGLNSTLTSNVLSYGILCGESNNTRIVTNLTQTSIEQYNVLRFDYLVVTPNMETTLVNFYINDSVTPIPYRVPAEHNTFEYPVTQAGGTLTIRIEANGVEKILQLEVITNTTYDFSIVDEGLKVKLDAEGRTNIGNNSDLIQWTNTAVLENDDPYKQYYGTLNNNFLFYSENNYDGWLRNANGHNFLRLRNRDKVNINLPVFNFSISNGKILDGMTFEIDFQTSNVTDYTVPIISCFEQDNAQSKSIIFTPQGLTINNTTELKTQFKEEERLTITIVVENSDNGPLYQLFKIYINGILSAATIYETTALNFTDISKGIIQIGSEKCTLDIYSIRFYNRPLTFPEVIKNWIANEDIYQNKINYFNRNNYGANQGRITMTDNAFTLASPNTPYMIITGEGDWNNEDGLNAMPTTKAAGTFSTEDKQIVVEYIDPLDSTKSFTTNFEGGSVGVAIQGTSSQEYKRKNYKIKLNVFRQNGITHVKKPAKSANKDEYYTDNTYTELKEGYTDEGYKLIDTSIPTFTFCIKADVASSESANNVQLVKLYNDIVKGIELTPPQGDNPNIRQGVDGYPMVVWYFNNKTKQYIFLGKYNFNNDKGTEEVYGFKDGDESWEVGNNEKLLCFFDESEDPTWENWRTAFETRFPDDDDSMTKKEDPYTDEQIADRLAGLREMVHWVSSKVIWNDNTKSSVDFYITPTSEDVANAARTGKTAEEEAFKREFKQYFNMNLITFFYVFTEFFLMVDNRAKNMFLTRYKVSSTRPNSSSWHNAYDSNVVELASSTSTRDTYTGWFSLPYDMDTAIGTNNVGVYTFDYHYESGDLQPSGAVVFNGQKSKLWVAFAQVFPSEIQSMYTRFQNNLSYTSLENSFEAHQGVWSETVVNEDMDAKYIDWITAYDANNQPLTRDTRALPMLLGLKTEQRKWWLENRFKYLNSKYAIDANTDFISLGARSGLLHIPVSVYADAYVTFKVGAQDSAPTTIRLAAGQSGIIERNATGEGGSDRVESSVSPASRISSIENLASLDLLNVDFTRATRLQTLRLGSANVTNTRLTSISLSGNKLLRLFDLRNYAAYTADLSVNECYNLEYIYLSGTQITNVNLPQGGVLKTIQYPTTINTIRIINQPYLENLIIGAYLPADEITDSVHEVLFNGNNNYDNITSIILDNIGENIDIPTMVNNANNLSNCSLSNLTFRMTTEDFRVFLKKLGDVNASITNCTIYLETAMPSDFTVSDITSKFDFKVYGKTEEGYAEYYNVRFYGFSNELIGTSSVVKGASIGGPTSYFTDEYLDNYNGLTEENKPEHPTRIGFGGWNPSPVNIQSDLSVRPIPRDEYRMEYHYLDGNAQSKITYTYLAAGEEITGITINNFIKDYYTYKLKYWTSDSNAPANYPNDDVRENVYANTTIVNKQAMVEAWYAVYSHDEPAIYDISIYNTNINGERVGEPIAVLKRTVIAGTTVGNTVTMSNLEQYKPAVNILAADGSNELNTPLENRKYQFLSWKPRIDSNVNLRVTGNQDILLTYYKTDDYYTNYFLNKLIKCNLDITSINDGAFYHNTNFVKLQTTATTIGKYCFANFTDSNIRNYFIFDGEGDITLGDYCFYGINNAIIIFNNTGHIIVNRDCFYRTTNCIIITRNATLPIINATDSTGSFYNFLNSSNTLYVNSTIYDNIYNSTNANNYSIPTYLINTAKERIVPITTNNQAAINSLIEEANNA